MSLVVCAKCSRLVWSGEGECRFCAAPMPAPRAAGARGRLSRSALLIGAAVVVTGELPSPFRACESVVTPAYGAPPIAVYGAPPPPPSSVLVAPGSDASADAGVEDARAPRNDRGKPSS